MVPRYKRSNQCTGLSLDYIFVDLIYGSSKETMLTYLLLLMPVVEKISELVVSVEGFIDEATSLLPSIMVILVVEVPIEMFSKIQPCFGSLPFFPLWAIHTGLPIFCTKKLKLSGPN